MKKLVLISTLIATFAGISAFGQGYVSFASSKSQAWDDFTSTTPTLATTINTAFMWGASGDVPLLAGILASTPVNGQTPYSYAAAWNDIMNDGNFTLAINAGNGSNVVARTAANGGIAYGASFGVTGTAPSTTYTLFFIGWNGAYATPGAAAAADAAVGWSSTFSYTTVTSIGTPASMAGVPQFGVGAVPEPTTIALAGLGGMALMMFRRRT